MTRSSPDIERWIKLEFAGHGVAIRREEDEPTPGEPFMSMADAKDLTRRAVAEFTTGGRCSDAAATPSEPVVTFKRWWVEQIRDQLVAMGAMPSGKLGDWAFLFREMLTDKLARTPDAAQPPAHPDVLMNVIQAKLNDYLELHNRGDLSEFGEHGWLVLVNLQRDMEFALKASTISSTDSCAECGHPRAEHSYNGACYGLCGKFVSPITSPQSKSGA